VSSCGLVISDEDLETTVTNMHSTFEDGCTVVDLRVVLGAKGTKASMSLPPRECTSGESQTAGDAGISSMTNLAWAFCPSTVVSAVSPIEQGRMSHMVCCHWKNKGWCKFQATCRFQHPADKRGVGKSLRVNPRQVKKTCGASGASSGGGPLFAADAAAAAPVMASA
jgi:hypothetical protein